ncbi:hypothetical protein LVJ83_01590 [Uruburuella testudinis]|uniref:Uncharacterized protein n=1 Tax=Uruburuella testudinis TaxID=1282863 RepID=A0ABY4DTL8_9NEIS|nr:hypothetical protein [Uruburuella testudinis]UOO82196.1 hypothetical protein LVJ83_01590 [Uruburuella testudinis]
MRGFLFLEMQMQGKKRSKIGHLVRLFNAADAFSGAKYTRKSNCPDTLVCRQNNLAAWVRLSARLCRLIPIHKNHLTALARLVVRLFPSSARRLVNLLL